MEMIHYSAKPPNWSQDTLDSKPTLSHKSSETRSDQYSLLSPAPLLLIDPPKADSRKFTFKFLVLWPLALHFLGSLATTETLIYGLNGRHLYLDRRPQVKLANGTYESNLLGQRNILQRDVNTMLSISLMLLRGIAGAWAAPLCWRIIFLLGRGCGLRRRDIKWVTNYGVLPPTTHFRNSLSLLIGLILLFTLVPSLASPLITGSISWVPSSSTIELPSHPIINLTGLTQEPLPRQTPGTGAAAAYSFDTYLVKNFITAWSQDANDHVFKRVVPSASQLDVNSTVENVTVPVFATTRIDWFSKATTEKDTRQKLQAMQLDDAQFPMLEFKLSVPGAVALIVNSTLSLVDPSDPSDLPPSTLSLLINVGREQFPESCNYSTTFLPSNTPIPYFPLYYDYSRWVLNGCFAYANVSYNAGSGACRNCRVGSYSTVQNDTELEGTKGTYSTKVAIRDLPQYILTLAPLKDSLPNPGDSLEMYVSAVLTRSYSALWNTWNDAYGEPANPANSSYKPAIPTLKAEIDQKRVYAWLALQLSLTFAGLVFIWLQSSSNYPLLVDTSMVSFDIDSTEVPRPSKHEREGILSIEPKDIG
ncbi:hypothetical protein FRC11_001213 [Ceratobasidium sp. 423]|nr:hypothetical protein FRC11_001213 [Ceratobasidium sp. 423]